MLGLQVAHESGVFAISLTAMQLRQADFMGVLHDEIVVETWATLQLLEVANILPGDKVFVLARLLVKYIGLLLLLQDVDRVVILLLVRVVKSGKASVLGCALLGALRLHVVSEVAGIFLG